MAEVTYKQSPNELRDADVVGVFRRPNVGDFRQLVGWRVYELFPTIIKLINFTVVMDFSTAVTLESFFLTLGGVTILFWSEDILALWFCWSGGIRLECI